jgi:hypothetical protein
MRDLLVVSGCIVILAGIIALCWPGGRLVARDTARKGKWGINRKIVFCPDCGHRMPKFRIPQSFRQGLWGGSTCGACGCNMDKWGQKIEASAIPKVKRV